LLVEILLIILFYLMEKHCIADTTYMRVKHCSDYMGIIKEDNAAILPGRMFMPGIKR